MSQIQRGWEGRCMVGFRNTAFDFAKSLTRHYESGEGRLPSAASTRTRVSAPHELSCPSSQLSSWERPFLRLSLPTLPASSALPSVPDSPSTRPSDRPQGPAYAVVPLPQVGSTTRSPGSEVMRRQRSITFRFV